MKIKICGIASERDAESAVAEGADLLGFAFLRGPRRIEPARVKRIVDALPAHVGTVGVFRNQPLEEVRSALAQSGVGMAQLNGAESPEFAAALGVKVIKSFAAFTRRSLEDVSRYDSFAYLADPGGKGTVNAGWATCAKKFGRVMISAPSDFGALHDLIHRVRPWGVDAAGVRGSEGIRSLVSAIRTADQETQRIRVTIR